MCPLLKKKSSEELDIENDPILMSSMNTKGSYTFLEISTGILTFVLLAGGAIALFFVLFGDKI